MKGRLRPDDTIVLGPGAWYTRIFASDRQERVRYSSRSAADTLLYIVDLYEGTWKRTIER